MNRRLISSMSSGFGLAACLYAGAANADRINVRVNGDPVRFEGAQPRQMNGRVLVPLRGVLEKMGANVDWIASNQTVVATMGDTELNLPIGSRTATVNGRDVRLDVPAMTIAGSTMVPLRFVSEALGADVRWSDATQTVAIETSGSGGIAAYRGARGAVNNNNNRDINNRDIASNTNRNSSGRNYRKSSSVTLPVGTVIPVTLDEALASNEARAGDPVKATLQSGRDDAGLPVGTKIEGVVREAVPARNGKPGVLDIDFTRVVYPNGGTRSIASSLISMDNKAISRDSSGRLEAKSGNANNERLKWVGIGAGAGLLISTLTKGNVLVDTLLGAGAGYLYDQVQRKGAGNVNLKAGTQIGVRLDKQMAFNPDRIDNSR